MSGRGLSLVYGIVMSWCTLMSVVILLNHTGNGVLSQFLIYCQFLSPCCQLHKDVMIIPPVILLFSLILPLYLQLELPSEPLGIDKLVDYPQLLFLDMHGSLWVSNSTWYGVLFCP